MTKYLRLFAAAALLSFAFACGGAADLGDEDANNDDVKASAEPTTWVTVAAAAAKKYASGTNLVVIDGHLGPVDNFLWTYTFVSDDGLSFATVQCDGVTAKVIEHHKNAARTMGQAMLDMTTVKVSVSKLMTIGQKQGLHGRVGSMVLSEALTQTMHPHWFLTQGGKEIIVDAKTAALVQ
ncbi:MAG: hypothetical protein JST92_00555 [Deltaproteobacteria bacterium]|nr:hypothetical protein [Deltaproteobacteria bacterium]